MLWSISALIAFCFAISSSTSITCYMNSTATETCDGYCAITYTSAPDYGESNTDQSCTSDETGVSKSICDIFGALNQCVSATVTYTNVSYTCNGTTPIISTNSVTENDKLECCNTNNCNSDFSGSCTTSSSAETYNTKSESCDYITYKNYPYYYNDQCGDDSAFYTQSSCYLSVAEILQFKCYCDTFQYLYSIATTSQRTQLMSDYNISGFDFTSTEYGCMAMSSCSWSSGLSYSVASYSFSVTFTLMGFTTATYSDKTAITFISTILSTYTYTTDTTQIYVTSTSIASSASSMSSITVMLQYATMTEANTTKTAIANGDVVFSYSGITANATVGSTIMTNSYTINTDTSSSDANMINYHYFFIFAALFSFLFFN